MRVRAYTIPTDQPESDGTLKWRDTTMVCVHVEAGGRTGFGYTYAAPAAASVVDSLLAPRLRGEDALDVARAWQKMRTAIRNKAREQGVWPPPGGADTLLTMANKIMLPASFSPVQ